MIGELILCFEKNDVTIAGKTRGKTHPGDTTADNNDISCYRHDHSLFIRTIYNMQGL
jgi:hypothetical protein